MIATLLLVSTWPFWLLLLIFLSFEVYLIEAEMTGNATLSLFAFICLIILFTDWQPWHAISWEKVIGWGLVYLFIGVLYAFPRWMVYVKDAAKAFEPEYHAAKARYDISDKKTSATFEEILRKQYKMPPMPWDYGVKGKIYMWMAYWPLSASWLLIHRPIEWFYDWAYATIKQTLESLSNKIFKAHFEGK